MDFDVHIGTREGWGTKVPLGLFRDDRRRHIYMIGQTGTGKSNLIKNLVRQDIERGEGCALIDPHGDLADAVLREIPKRRINDVVIFDPSDSDHVIGYNPFFQVPKDERSLAAANITASMKHIWRDSWGPRLERILYQTVRALLDAPRHLQPSMLSIPLMFVDDDYRSAVMKYVQDPEANRFFQQVFARWNERQRSEYIESSDNKISQFISNPFIRNILGQYRPSVDLAHIMASQKILIVRLSKGTLGEEPANLLGSLLTAGFQQVAMRRAAIPEDARDDFHLHIDEFHNFTTSAFVSILSEARKYGLTLTTANQFMAQLDPDTQAAVFGNVGNIIAFRTSAGDAEQLSREIPEYPPSAFRDLGRGQICARLLQGGEVEEARIGSTELANHPEHDHTQKILAESRQRYATPRSVVEKRLGQTITHQTKDL